MVLYSHLSFTVEAKNLEANTWSTTSLNLMEMSEEVKPRSSPSIVQLALCQNT